MAVAQYKVALLVRVFLYFTRTSVTTRRKEKKENIILKSEDILVVLSS